MRVQTYFLQQYATSPTAFLFGKLTGSFPLKVKAGLGVNIVGVAVVMLGMFTWIVPLFDLQTYPSWAPVISNETMPWHARMFWPSFGEF